MHSHGYVYMDYLWNIEGNLLKVVRGAGFPLRNDPFILSKYNGLYAWVQIEVDYASTLPDKFLVKRSSLNFFVRLEYEDLPLFYSSCSIIGHKLSSCRRGREDKTGHQGRNVAVEKYNRFDVEKMKRID